MEENMSSDYYSPRQVATMAGKSYMQIMRKIRSGEIKAVKIGWNWAIPVSEYNGSDNADETN